MSDDYKCPEVGCDGDVSIRGYDEAYWWCTCCEASGPIRTTVAEALAGLEMRHEMRRAWELARGAG